MPSCPECGSDKLWRDGLRYNGDEQVQRWRCRSCGLRFSENSRKNRLSVSTQRDGRQICALQTRRVKNLAKVEAYLKPNKAGENEDSRAYLINYETKLILKGLKPKTILDRLRMLKLLQKRGVNLLDPESVFHGINHAKKINHATKTPSEKDWTEGSKSCASKGYVSFCQISSIEIPQHINFGKWSKQRTKLPWIPLEREVDALIACSSRKVSTFLQLLKETGMRCGEAWRLTWTDIDVEHNIVSCNYPEKGSNPRQFKISSKLVAMLNLLPKMGPKIFGNSQLSQFRQNFMTQRKRASSKLQNPRLQKISFHILRHFYGTMLYHRTKDILYVKEKLGHRNINSTLIYTQLVCFDKDDYASKTAKTTKEASQLVEAGFEYVCTTPESVMLFRKRK